VQSGIVTSAEISVIANTIKAPVMKQLSGEQNCIDPVCGMEVSRAIAIEEFVYQVRLAISVF